jgi:hypothetical protein
MPEVIPLPEYQTVVLTITGTVSGKKLTITGNAKVQLENDSAQIEWVTASDGTNFIVHSDERLN